MYQVTKRDGEITEFNLTKISEAIRKAFEAREKEYNQDIIDLLALKVTADFEPKLKEHKIAVEDIQDSVESVLIKAGYADVAKGYILYRKQREKIRNLNSTLLDYKEIVDSYVKVTDWRVKENSTVTYSVGGLILSNSGAITANYWLSEIYDEEIGKAHKNADIHIHDLSMLTGYCAGWSLKQLIQEGLGGVTGRITSAPAKHLSVLCNQMVNFLGIMQNEWAGAQAFSSFDTYLAPFVKADHLTYREVKKCIESFIFGVNIPSRWGTQAPFSNITLDWTVPNDLAINFSNCFFLIKIRLPFITYQSPCRFSSTSRRSLFCPIVKYLDASSMVRVYFSHTGISIFSFIMPPPTCSLCHTGRRVSALPGLSAVNGRLACWKGKCCTLPCLPYPRHVPTLLKRHGLQGNKIP